MNQQWQTLRLGEVASVGAGNPAPQDRSHFKDGIYPFVRTSDVGRIRFGQIDGSADYLNQTGASGLRLFPKDTILLPKSGASTFLNHRVMLAVDAYVSSHLATVTADTERVCPKYLLYFLSTIAAQDLIQDHAYPSLNRSVIEAIETPVPAVSEQQQIVAILDEAFAGIAAAKANAEKNLQNARALFESYLNEVFTRRGEGWVETTVDRLSTNLDSRRIPITKAARAPGEYPYYGASGIVDYVAGYIFEGDSLLVSEDGANLLMRSTPIAFSVSGRYWVNNHAHVLKFTNLATQKIVQFYLESIKVDQYITGAAQPKLTQRALNAIPIHIPSSIERQQEVVSGIEAVAAESQRFVSIYQRKLAAIDELKKSILYQAFTGELTAKRVEEMVA